MTQSLKVPAAEVAGIDLAYRPASYFWPLGLETHLLARIKGAERKATVQRLIDAGDLESVPELLLQSTLSSEMRQALGRIHPSMMGGEYLPDLASNEVEIARIRIKSTTQDVTSVYARRRKNRIAYRVVDEYDGDTLSEKRTRTSSRPLTLGALEAFLNGTWSIFEVLAANFGEAGYDLDEMLAFTRVESQFYPQIGELYRRRIETWAVEQQRANVPDVAPVAQPGGASSAGAAEGRARIDRCLARDRRCLDSFVQKLNNGVSLDEMDDDLKLWWLNRY